MSSYIAVFHPFSCGLGLSDNCCFIMSHVSFVVWCVFLFSPLWVSVKAMLSHFSRVLLFGTPWAVALHGLLSMGFSWQEYWSGLPCPPPGDLPNLGVKAVSPELQVGSLLLSHWGSLWILRDDCNSPYVWGDNQCSIFGPLPLANFARLLVCL